MRKEPIISVIVPVYKAEKYLHKCVDSLLEQTFTDFEILLVDDGSPDKSGEICDEYAEKDSRIRVFHKENGGVSSARNLALDNAKGEFVMFLDSDDWLDNVCLDVCINTINDNVLDVLQFGFMYVYDTYQVSKVKRYSSILDGNAFVNSNSFNICAGGGIYKKKIVDNHNIRFVTELIMAEDQVFVYNVLKYSQRCMYIGEPLYYYYQNSNAGFRRKKTSDMIKSCYHLILMANDWPASKKSIDTMVVSFLIKIILNEDKKVSIFEIKKIYEELEPNFFWGDKFSYFVFCLLANINFSFVAKLILFVKKISKTFLLKKNKRG